MSKVAGNAGMTNTLRVLGVLPAIAVFIFDACKSVIPILLAKYLITLGSIPIENLEYAAELAVLIAAFATVIGHDYPIYYNFRGGKGIATSLGAIMLIEWKLGLVCFVFALVLMLASRMVSLGSIVASLLYPVLVVIIGSKFSYPIPYIAFACLLATINIYKHKSNIKRLLDGTENKLWKTKKEKFEEACKVADDAKLSDEAENKDQDLGNSKEETSNNE